jgi:hypothetical protein
MTFDLALAPDDAVLDVGQFRREATQLRAVMVANASTLSATSSGMKVDDLISALSDVIALLDTAKDDAVTTAIRRSRQMAVAVRVMDRHADALQELAK